MTKVNAPIRLVADNTGVHSAGLCLLSKARSKLDVRGLLQLATLLIFSDEIAISELEPEAVVRTSSEIIGIIVRSGFDKNVIRLVGDREAYMNACQMAADTSNMYLSNFGFNPSERSTKELAPTNVVELQRQFVNFFWSVVDADEVAYLAASTYERTGVKSSDATKYMIAYSSDLRQSIREIVSSRQEWDDSRVIMLDAFLRFYLNESHAEKIDGNYVPAVARAEIIRDTNKVASDLITNEINLVNEMDKVVDSVVSLLRGAPLPMPAVAAALVRKSKGNVFGILDAARSMREAAEPLRDWIRLAWRHACLGSYDELDRIFLELRRELEAALRLDGAPHWIDAFEFTLLPVPSIKVKARKLREAYRFKSIQRRIAVLTEISKTSAYFDSEAYFEKLFLDARYKSKSHNINSEDKTKTDDPE